MNAAPLLNSVVAALTEARLKAVLIGNSAAAIHEAPVATLEVDFAPKSDFTHHVSRPHVIAR
jgi:hypothetical protein